MLLSIGGNGCALHWICALEIILGLCTLNNIILWFLEDTHCRMKTGHHFVSIKVTFCYMGASGKHTAVVNAESLSSVIIVLSLFWEHEYCHSINLHSAGKGDPSSIRQRRRAMETLEIQMNIQIRCHMLPIHGHRLRMKYFICSRPWDSLYKRWTKACLHSLEVSWIGNKWYLIWGRLSSERNVWGCLHEISDWK